MKYPIYKILIILLVIFSMAIFQEASVFAKDQKFFPSIQKGEVTCDPQVILKDQNGQLRPAISNFKDPAGVCRSYVSFDQQDGLSSAIPAVPSQQSLSQSDYFDLAAHYAPVWYQDTDSSDYDADYITNFDFDLNWNGLDNWEHQDDAPFHPLRAYIYYSVVETSTHWFIIYVDFHPRDWCDNFLCTEHENDMEGVQIVVKKDGTPFGQFLLASTQAHGSLEFYPEHPEVVVRDPLNLGYYYNPAVGVPMFGSHPKVYVEAKGHGVYVRESETGVDEPDLGNPPVDQTFGGDGIIYWYTGSADAPSGGNDSDGVGYALLPISEAFWSRRSGSNETFTSHFTYNGMRGFTLPEQIAGAFRGDTHGDNKANPPWAWNDSSYVTNKGDWAIDPAYAFDRIASFDHAYSMDYVDNFYLDKTVGKVIAVDNNNAGQYFQLAYVGPYGINANCEDNNYNKWCMENGIPHWPMSMIGCYEIADDSGSNDCRYDPNHSNVIIYSWLETAYDYHLDFVDHITVRAMTKRNVCSSLTGESDDGWEYKPDSGYVLSLTLNQNNGWIDQYCEPGNLVNGHGGPFQIRALFDGDLVFNGLEVRAGDHKDEGAFEVVGVDVALKPMFCEDGTLTGTCNVQRKFCDENLEFINNCSVCGCPVGQSCTVSGVCRTPSGTCFLAGTLITLADGRAKPIEDVNVGDLVKSVDQEGRIVSNPVTEIFVHPPAKGYLVVGTSDGQQLKVTPDHMVFSGSEYQAIGKLKIGSPLSFLQEGKLSGTKIISIKKVDSTEKVYNFEVKDTHVYFANSILVHNIKLPQQNDSPSQ